MYSIEYIILQNSYVETVPENSKIKRKKANFL